MKLSLEWLKQYVDLPDLEPKEIAHKLTMATAEVESVDVLKRYIEGIVVGEVTNIEPIDTSKNSKSMHSVTVNTGSETFETVCGAPNVAVGMKSAFAAPGVNISNGLVVKEQELYSHKSQGILCSPKELGWGESHFGIMAFPDTMVPGTVLSEYVPAEDYIIDIDNKTITHRPDLWGHYGFARELAAIFGSELKPLDIANASEWSKLDAIPLKIEDIENCPGYCCLDINGLKPAYSPLEIQYRLLSIGLRPINLLVDLTNYIMCELGQPMHAFDGNRVRDIVVGPFGSKGTFNTLDSIDRDMNPDDLMIFDHTGPIAIAGIMGGEETEITDDTSRVLLESANFNPARIRRTSLRLGLRSDASMRFEKGQPPYHMGLSIKRFVRLLENAGQKTKILSSLTSAGDTGEKERRLEISTEKITRFIGMDIPDDTIVNILQSLGFDCNLTNGELNLTIPPYRSERDISIPNDIIEEVARIYGYDNITPSMPEVKMHSYTFNAQLQKQHKIRNLLSTGRGFNEIHTYSWYDNFWLKRIGYDPGNTLELANPATEFTNRLRLELLPNLLMLIESNSLYKDRFSIYEVGNVFHPSKDGCDQFLNLAGVEYQTDKSGSLQDMFLSTKGTVEEIFTITNSGTPVFAESKYTTKPWEAENATMDISLDGKNVGQIGYLNEKTFGVFEKDIQVAWFELNLDLLSGSTYPSIEYENIPMYPGSWMDFSILADKSSNYDSLAATVDEFTHSIMKKRKFLYLYDGKGLPEGKVSYTFRFWLGLKKRTLTGDDLSNFHVSFLAFLQKHALTLR
ncbi:phenylalanine--tRNA ligase subunit beta [Candidatus Latescibacterota bacterium]